MSTFECKETNDSPAWGVVNIVKWKFWPARWGGGRPYLELFKDTWVYHNRAHILSAAKRYGYQPELLAGVFWNEGGGDPDSIDWPTFDSRRMVRAFTRNPSKSLGMLSVHPSKTSIAPGSIQLRRAADVLGLDINKMTPQEQQDLSYGKAIVKRWNRFTRLLQGIAPEGRRS
jgi:hypothetical protein